RNVTGVQTCALPIFRDHDMRVQLRRAILGGEVAKKAHDLDLLIEGDARVFPGLDVEEAEHHVPERAEAGKLTARDVMCAREIEQNARASRRGRGRMS